MIILNKKNLYLFLSAQLIGWTVIPSLIFPNAPLDVIEGFLWGQAWQLGYYKHPPLQAWLLEITYQIFGNRPVGYFLLSQLTVVLAMLGIYKTAHRLTDPTRAIIATLALTGIYYFNFTSIEFNPNVLLLATWAWCCYYFVLAVQNQSWYAWMMLGVWLALAALSKYFSFILGISFIVYMLIDPTTRKQLLTPKPYIAFLLCLGILAPHLQWLIQSDYLPFQYALSRGSQSGHSWFSNHIAKPLKFTLSQFLAALFSILLIAILKLKRHSPQLSLLFCITFFPFCATLLLGGLTGLRLRDMWGMPLVSFIPLYLVCYHVPELIPNRVKLFKRGVCFVFLLSIVVMVILQSTGKSFSRMNYPGKALAQAWQKQWPYSQAPYALVGEYWQAGNASFYSRSRPWVFIDGDHTKSPWIRIENVALQGAVIIQEDIENIEVISKRLQIPYTLLKPVTINGKILHLAIIMSSVNQP